MQLCTIRMVDLVHVHIGYRIHGRLWHIIMEQCSQAETKTMTAGGHTTVLRSTAGLGGGMGLVQLCQSKRCLLLLTQYHRLHWDLVVGLALLLLFFKLETTVLRSTAGLGGGIGTAAMPI